MAVQHSQGQPGTWRRAISAGRHGQVGCVAVAMVLCLAATSALAQREAVSGTWQEQARSEGLSTRDLERLGADKLLVGSQEFRQSFEPYAFNPLPQFVTSDAVLNGFNVLLLESVRRWERRNAETLPGILEGMWQCLECSASRVDGNPELAEAARRRARIVVGVALRLVGRELPGAGDALSRTIDAEVEKVAAAATLEMPAWLGLPRPDFMVLDYSRFRPRGVYDLDDHMRGYFRAVEWLQAIPFRVDDDEELLAFVLIGCPFFGRNGCERCVAWRRVLQAYLDRLAWLGEPREGRSTGSILGTQMDRLEITGEDSHLLWWRKELTQQPDFEQPLSEADQLRLPSDGAEAPTPTLRVLPSIQLPETGMFAHTTDPGRVPDRPLPEGLEVAAALGSSFTRDLLGKDHAPSLLAAIDEAGGPLRGSSLVPRYYDCLRALLDEPEPDAPAFVRGPQWQRKSVQTTLSAWAQIRHLLVLQAQESQVYGGLVDTPAGFVEPDPELFSRLADLTAEVRLRLQEIGALEPDWRLTAPLVRWNLEHVERKLKEPSDPDLDLDLPPFLSPRFELVGLLQPDARSLRDVDWPQARASLAELSRRLENGVAPENPEIRQRLLWEQVNLAASWELLERLCARLAAMAHKQLRGRPWSPEEERLLKDFGGTLGNVMLYGGNSWLLPEDDAPLVVDVASNPVAGEVLLVGIGRPRALYVLYPWQGREILCRGAVLPYFEEASALRLTDIEWRARLDRPERPLPPAWVLPLLSDAPIRPPKADKD